MLRIREGSWKREANVIGGDVIIVSWESWGDMAITCACALSICNDTLSLLRNSCKWTRSSNRNKMEATEVCSSDTPSDTKQLTTNEVVVFLII